MTHLKQLSVSFSCAFTVTSLDRSNPAFEVFNQLLDSAPPMADKIFFCDGHFRERGLKAIGLEHRVIAKSTLPPPVRQNGARHNAFEHFDTIEPKQGYDGAEARAPVGFSMQVSQQQLNVVIATSLFSGITG